MARKTAADEEVAFEVEEFVVDLKEPATVQELIETGRYGYVNPHLSQWYNMRGLPINSCFLVKAFWKLPSWWLELCSVPKVTAVEQAETRGFRPATFYELLAFGAKYPDQQRSYKIEALGSVDTADLVPKRGGEAISPALDFYEGKRRLILTVYYPGIYCDWLGDNTPRLSEDTRLLMVRA